MIDSPFTFSIKRTAFNEDYRPADNTRVTTNFANLARGESRQEDLRNTLRLIDNRFNWPIGTIPRAIAIRSNSRSSPSR